MASERPDLRDVYRARAAIVGSARRTPLVPSPDLSRRAGAEVWLKLETLQDTGAFKIRGAANRLVHLSAAERERGVVTVSSGNHGRAVAHAAERLGLPAVVCMSPLVPETKVAAIRALGAEVNIVGRDQDDAEAEARRLAESRGLVMISPFDDPLVIAGQGTIGLELLEDAPDLDTVVVPLSGGGLLGGIAIALKAASARLRVIGVSMERGPAMVESLRAGKPVPVEEVPTLADALGGSIGLENRYTFAIVRDLMDDAVLVSEDEIAAAMAYSFWTERLVVEGGGAVGIAALLAGKIAALGRRVAVVVSGRSVDMAKLRTIIDDYAPEGVASASSG